MIKKMQALWYYRPEPGRVDWVMVALYGVNMASVLGMILSVATFFYIVTAGPDRAAYISSFFN